MPRDLRNLRNDMEGKFSNLDHEIPQPIKNEFYQQLELIIPRLTFAYQNQLDLQDKLLYHTALHSTLLQLRCRYIEHYLYTQNRTALELDLSNAIKNAAIATSHVGLQADLAKFLTGRVAGYVGFVLLAVKRDFFDLNRIFTDLKINILTEFVTYERAMYGYNMFESFAEQLTLILQILVQHIEVETITDSIDELTAKYTPNGYSFALRDSRADFGSTDPCRFMQNLLDSFLIYTQREFSLAKIPSRMPSIIKLAQIHQAEMQTIADDKQAIVAHYAALNVKHSRLKIWALSKAPQIINHCLQSRRQEWAIEIVRLFKGGIMNYVVANCLYIEAEKALEQYYKFPARFCISSETACAASSSTQSGSSARLTN